MAKRPPKPDMPIAFGFKCAWYAVKTNDVAAVADVLGLEDVVESTWKRGITAAYAEKVFVTPPLFDWVLVAGWKLFYEGNAPAPSVVPLLTKLSKKFAEAQYFATHRVPEAHCWALARKGKLIRGYGYVGDRGEINWNEGKPTQADRIFLKHVGIPDESTVMQFAAKWSIDPSDLEVGDWKPGLGRLGTLP